MVFNSLGVALWVKAVQSSKRVARFISLLCQYMRCEGLRVFVASLFNYRGEVIVHPRQLRAPLTLRLGTSDFRIYGQVIERSEYTLSLSHPPGVIIDAGANIGLTAIYYVNRFPTARILAIEPEAANFNLLGKNAAAYPQIVPIRAALWDEPTTLEVVGIPGLYGAVRVQLSGQIEGWPVLGQVSTVTMPQLMAEYQLEFVDLLKMDIEGAEKEVFATAIPWIAQVGVIIAELHDRFRPGCTPSFRAATRHFDLEWYRGEHVIMARRNFIAEHLT